MKRRNFIKKTSLVSIGLGIANDTFSKNYKEKINLNMNALPIVIATWDVKNATKKAWRTMQNNESSLDAIEKGCMVKLAISRFNRIWYITDNILRYPSANSQHHGFCFYFLNLTINMVAYVYIVCIFG